MTNVQKYNFHSTRNTKHIKNLIWQMRVQKYSIREMVLWVFTLKRWTVLESERPWFEHHPPRKPENWMLSLRPSFLWDAPLRCWLIDVPLVSRQCSGLIVGGGSVHEAVPYFRRTARLRKPKHSQNYHFYAVWNCEKQLLASSCLSVRPHGTTRLPLDGLSWNLMFCYFSEICRGNSSFVNIWQE